MRSIIGAGVAVGVASFGYLHSRVYSKQASDIVDFVGILQYFYNVGDFATDILFTYVLYLQNEASMFLISSITLIIVFCVK